jgi:guanine deaminase
MTAERWMLKGGLVQARPSEAALPSDIVIDGETIIAIGPDIDPQVNAVSRVVLASGKLLTPGFINTHYHSHDRWDRGRFSPTPLEIWMGLYSPPTVARGWTPRETYLRTLLGGFELIRGGATAVLDDVHLGLQLDEETIEAVLRAYEDLGLRATVGIAYSDRPAHETVPYLADELPPHLKGRGQVVAKTTGEMLSLWKDLAAKWSGRVKATISVSGPQRCTERFQQEAAALARNLKRPYLTHVLETRVQALTGPLFYGRSLLAYMDEIDALPEWAVLMHAVWMSPDDLDRVAASGASIAHNPASNLKLGSGIAPVIEMLARNIPVGLGTDNHNANDGCSMFEALKWGVLLQTCTTHEDRLWLTAEDGVRMATQSGARAFGEVDHIGELAVGKQADILVFDLAADSFIPLNDVKAQLVFTDAPRAVRSVFIAGQCVLDEGRFAMVDEGEIRREIADRIGVIQKKVLDGVPAAREMAPHLRATYDKCLKDPLMSQYLYRYNCCPPQARFAAEAMG